MKYKIELTGYGITSHTEDAEKLKKAIVECFNSKTELDVYDEEDERVGSVWHDPLQEEGWNYFYTI